MSGTGSRVIAKIQQHSLIKTPGRLGLGECRFGFWLLLYEKNMNIKSDNRKIKRKSLKETRCMDCKKTLGL